MLKDYVKTVLRNYAKRHFENITALSIWQMRYLDFYAPLSSKLNLAVILRDVNPDTLITLFELNAEIQKLPDIDSTAEVFDASTFLVRYAKGFLPEIYVVKYGDFIEGTDFYNELVERGYRCSEETVDETLDRAFISYGMAINDLLSGNSKSAVDNIVYSLGYATIALYQHKRRDIPNKLSEVIELIPESKRGAIEALINRIIDLVNRSDIVEHLESLVERNLYPHEQLQIMLQDDYGRELILQQYQLLRIVWEEINNRLLPVELFIKRLLTATEELPYMQIEIRGTKPAPVVRVKGPIMRAFELA